MAINKVVFGNDTLIDLTEDSVSASNLLEGETAHDRSGTSVTGTAKQGHIIQNVNGTDLTQRAKLQFADADVTDDSINQKTIINVVRERTQAEYDVMSAADQAKGIINITDANAKPLFASQVRYGNGTVADALYVVLFNPTTSTKVFDSDTDTTQQGNYKVGEYTIPSDGMYRIAQTLNAQGEEIIIQVNGLSINYLTEKGRYSNIIPFAKGAVVRVQVSGTANVVIRQFS